MREYIGKGKLIFPDIPEVEGDFKINFNDNGNTTLEFGTTFEKGHKLSELPWTIGKFQGLSTSPVCQIEINQLYILGAEIGGGSLFPLLLKSKISYPVKIIYRQLSSEKVEVRRDLTNFIFSGIEMVQQRDRLVRALTTCKINGTEVYFIRLPDFEQIKNHLIESKDVRVTCELKLQGYYKNLSILREICDNLQNLCSLSSGNFVTPLYENIYNAEQICETTLFPLKTYPFSNSPSLIDNSFVGNKDFKDFIETTYQKYTNLKDKLGLSYFIEFFTTSKMYSPLK